MGAEIIGPLARPHKVSGSFSMDARLPIFVLWPMALTAEPVAFFKIDEFSIVKSESVSILCIMTIETPPHGLRMMQPNLSMLLF